MNSNENQNFLVKGHTKSQTSIVANPWLKISPCDMDKISDGDEGLLGTYINKCQNSSENRSSLNLWPEPYVGDPNAPVYLLNGNPGYSNFDHLFTEDKEYVDFAKKNIEHKSLYPLNDFLYFNIIHTRGIVHGGSLWWKEKTSFVRNELCGNYPYVFDVEYSPYHSKNGQMPNQKNLEQTNAYRYTDKLLLAAIKADKLFVIMRKQKEWMERLERIASSNNHILNYDNILMLSSVNNVCISQKNVKYCPKTNPFQTISAWDKLINILKQHCPGRTGRNCCGKVKGSVCLGKKHP